MEAGPPGKRDRMNSGSWGNGHPEPYARERELPPVSVQYPPQHTYPRTQIGPPHPMDDRRPHEPEYPPPVPDVHRPHAVAPSIYHSVPFSGPGPREPQVKRDPSDDPTHPHALRPHSTGDINQEHARPPPPDDHRRQSMAGYDGLNRPPLNQPYQSAPSYPIPPHQPGPMYDRSYDPPQTPGGSYAPGIPYTGSSSANNQRKKAPRTSQACAQCRAAKGKCDDPKPCSACREKKIECDWKAPEPKQGDKVQAQMMETMQQILESQHEATRRLERRMDSLQKAVARSVPNLDVELKSEDGNDERLVSIENAMSPRRSIEARHTSSVDVDEEKYTPMQTDDHNALSPKNDTDEDDTGKPVQPDEPAIPVGHTTGAARLLTWPSINEMVGDLVREKKIREEYPFLKERKNGIRLYGVGPTQAPSPEYTGEDSYSDLHSDSPAEDNTYGQVVGDTPPANVHVAREPKGGLRPDGTLDLDRTTVKRLTQSYMSNMHIMHPILDPQQFDNMSEVILKKMPPPDVSKAKVHAGFVVKHHGEPPNKKQKHSPKSTSEPIEALLKPWEYPKSIGFAVFLLVLALGKICEHKDKLPNVLSDDDRPLIDSPSVRNGFPSPSQASPTISSKSSGLPSPQEGDRGSRNPRRTSVDGQGRHRGTPQVSPQNSDIIPGLAYAEKATDILGNQLGEYTLAHVHAFTLASLYFGQLVLPFRSHAYIYAAGSSLQVLLKMKNEKLKKIKMEGRRVSPQDNPLVFAFWTILQLESDILAELDLPHSGISRFEQYMPWPNTVYAESEGQITRRQAASYNAQLWLRNHLNAIHSQVYGPGMDEAYKLTGDSEPTFPVLDIFLDIVPKSESTENFQEFAWKRGDPFPNDVLAARLRAKFYGAQVITYRPFLMMVMNRASRYDSRVQKERIPTRFLKYSKFCIDALIDSTKSFYGMPPGQRLVLTNVWGTSHAQWGNVLVLLAAYRDPLLNDLINGAELKELVEKILKFLGEVAKPKSSLKIDILILEHAARKAKLLSTPDFHAIMNSSFSSTTTGFEGTPQPQPHH